MLSKSIRRAECASRRRMNLNSALGRAVLVTSSLPHYLSLSPHPAVPSASRASTSGVRFLSQGQQSPSRGDSLELAVRTFCRSVENPKNYDAIFDAYREFARLFQEAGGLGSEAGRNILSSPSGAQMYSKGLWRKPRSRSSLNRTISNSLLQDTIRILAGSYSLAHLELAAQILSDMPHVYGLTPLTPLHPVVLAGLVRVDPSKAFAWVRKLELLRLPHCIISEADYVMVVQGFTSRLHRDGEGAYRVIEHLRSSSQSSVPAPTAAIWQPYLRFLAMEGTRTSKFAFFDQSLVEATERDRVSLTAPILADAVIQRRLAQDREGASQYAEQLREVLQKTSPHYTPSEEHYATAALVGYHGMAGGGYTAALEAALLMKAAGYSHNSTTIRTLMGMDDCPSLDAKSLVDLGMKLNTNITVDVWANAVSRALKDKAGDGLSTALGLYEESKRREVIPVAGLVDPLIQALCTRSNPPSSKDVHDALELYYDLRDATFTIDSAPSEAFPQLRPRSHAPDAGIYMNLLRAITRSRSAPQTASDIVIQLLIDMKHYLVKVPSRFLMDSVYGEMLRVADSHDTAFKIWSHVRELDDSAATPAGYKTALVNFAKLGFDSDPLPSLNHYLVIVKSMRDAGTPISPFVYTVLLTRYATLAKSIRRDATNLESEDTPQLEIDSEFDSDISIQPDSRQALRERLLQAVQRLHLTLRVDASLTPTVATMNALMNAYNHLEAFRDAYGVWEQLTLGTPPFDQVSVSIVLDLCGHTENAKAADDVWRRVRTPRPSSSWIHNNKLWDSSGRFITSTNNWTSLIECRWRCGKRESAFNAFREMLDARADRSHVPVPDLKCAETMLKFAKKNGMDSEVRVLRMLEDNAPDLYRSLVPLAANARPP